MKEGQHWLPQRQLVNFGDENGEIIQFNTQSRSFTNAAKPKCFAVMNNIWSVEFEHSDFMEYIDNECLDVVLNMAESKLSPKSTADWNRLYDFLAVLDFRNPVAKDLHSTIYAQSFESFYKDNEALMKQKSKEDYKKQFYTGSYENFVRNHRIVEWFKSSRCYVLETPELIIGSYPLLKLKIHNNHLAYFKDDNKNRLGCEYWALVFVPICRFTSLCFLGSKFRNIIRPTDPNYIANFMNTSMVRLGRFTYSHPEAKEMILNLDPNPPNVNIYYF